MKLINIWYTQFDISYRPRSKQTNWVLFYLICFSVINSPAEGIIPSRKRKIKKSKKKSIRYITQRRRLARLPWSIRVIMGLVISFLGLSGNADLFFAPCGFPSQIRCRHRDRKTDTVVLWHCETPSASEGSSNFLSFFISVEFLSSLMYLTCVWQRWLCAIGVDASCSLPRLPVFLGWACMSLYLLEHYTHIRYEDTFVLVYTVCALWLKQTVIFLCAHPR